MGVRVINRRRVLVNPIANAGRVTKRDVQYAAASYQNLVKEYGENNMATQRAYWKYLELQRAWDAQRGK